MRTVKPLALQILHADGTIVGIEQHACRQRVQLDPQPIRMARRDVEQPFARSHPLVPVGAERREAESVGVAPQQAPIVGVQSRLHQASQCSHRARRAMQRRDRGIGERLPAAAGPRAPATAWRTRWAASRPSHVPSGPGRVATRRATPAGSGSLQPLEVAAHVGRAPRCVAGQRRDLVPIGVVRRHQDHRIVRGAAAERAGARIVDAVGCSLRSRRCRASSA